MKDIEFNALLESKGFAMRTFLFLGSKGGSGRTASSVILATGLAALGHRPLHLQVTMSGIQPVIAFATGVPFSTAALAEHVATPEAIRHTIAAHPECSTVVIDMVKRTVWETVFDNPTSVVLFPMRHAAVEIEVAVRDYRDLQTHLASASDPRFRFHRRTARPRYNARPPIASLDRGWLLPVAWPEDLDDHAVAAKVERFDGPMRAGLPGPRILKRGIADISKEHLDDLVNTSHYICSRTVEATAVAVAQSVSELCV
ncbi:ParA family protein [Tardiphaga sp. P9-11]|uniref:ParA family protein n=1 Tax=Tardiphaga sp. P9-11 TaxID=2024614 RepID=UPI0011F3C047|nr:ParA family protein [Tardiphaga sp. P9-11]